MLSRRAKSELDWFTAEYARQLHNQSGSSPCAVDMATAENWLIRNELIATFKASVATQLRPQSLSYATGLGGPKDLLAAASQFYNHFFYPYRKVVPEHLVAGAGCSSVLESIVYNICDHGDGILIDAPMWGSFKISCVMRNGVNLILVPPPPPSHPCAAAGDVVQRYRQALREASPTKIRGLLFCNPQNPLGRPYPRAVTEALLRFCEDEDLHFISDEIYALSTFGSVGSGGATAKRDEKATASVVEPPELAFTSALQLDLRGAGVNPARVLVLHGISKDLCSSGLRLGFAIVQANPELRMSLAIVNNAKLSNATALMATTLLSNINQLQRLLNINLVRLREAASLVVDFLSFHEVAFYRPVAGVFVWARLGGRNATWEREAKLADACASAGVLVGPGSSYSALEPGWFRLAFAIPRPELLRGLRCLEKGIGWEKSWSPAGVAEERSKVGCVMQ